MRTVTVYANQSGEFVEAGHVPFGEPIPSAIAGVGHAGLAEVEA